MPVPDTFIAAGLFIAFAVFLIVPVPAADESCSLTIDSIPQGGNVFIDGMNYGHSPVRNITVSCGAHTIGVQMEGYADYVAATGFEGGNHRDITASLQRVTDRGQVTIRSDPPGGDLFVDGKARGVTPCTIGNLERGRHEILIKKAGYEDYHDVVSADTGSGIGYTEYLVPLPVTGFLTVSSDPDGAEIEIDGSSAGSTPTNLQRIGAGNHTVVLHKAGYWNFSGTIYVPGGEAVLARADLAPVPATCTLYLDSTPGGLGIYLNGTFKGFTPLTLETVPPGDYLLQISRLQEGLLANRSLRLSPGSTHEIFADLADGNGGSIADNAWEYRNKTGMTAQPGWQSVHTTTVIEKSYTWYAQGHEATITVDIPQELYAYYKNQPHPTNVSRDTVSRYAINTNDRQYLHDLVAGLKDASDFRSYAARNDYRNVVAFVQSITYEKDTDPITKAETDYWKYPVETLTDGTGDCEDTAILTAALLKEMGYDVAVVFLPDHAAVAVSCDNCNGYYYPLDGKRYYYLETTGAGYPPGAMDKQYRTAAASVIPL